VCFLGHKNCVHELTRWTQTKPAPGFADGDVAHCQLVIATPIARKSYLIAQHGYVLLSYGYAMLCHAMVDLSYALLKISCFHYFTKFSQAMTRTDALRSVR
jgi:hypothetical protein